MMTNRFSKIILIILFFLLAPIPGFGTTAAKYVIVFQGDGMGPEHVRAGGMYALGAAGTLVFESFPSQTTLTHDNIYGTTTDSAASATAMACGFKAANGTISIRQPGDGTLQTTVLELHHALGRSTGLVTTSFLTDASPAAYGAHNSSRNNFEEIFSDFVNLTQPDVLLGGGGNGFHTDQANSKGYTVITTRSELLSLDTESAEKIAGSFGAGLIPAEGLAGRDATLPTLPEMTQQALAMLDNNPSGFFAFIEHEGIDEYSHANEDEGLVRAMLELNNAVQVAVNWVEDASNDADWSNTLLIVLADHETGGLTVTETDPIANSIPAMAWSSTGHTSTPVPVYAQGRDADQITGAQIDNSDIFLIIGPAIAEVGTTTTLAMGQDTWLDSGAPDTTHGADVKLATDGDPDNGALIQWDLRCIPAGSVIHAASLLFSLPDANDQSGSVYELYALLRDWSESHATWNDYDSAVAWTTGGGQGSGTDYATHVLGSSPTFGTPMTRLGLMLNTDGIAQLQRWVDGTDPNYGLIIFNYNDSQSDGFRFSSFESANPPRLVIHYAPPSATPSATTILTPVVSVTPTATPSYTTTAPLINLLGHQVLAFPNPASDQMQFAIQLDQPGVVSVRIYNLAGEQIAAIQEHLPGGVQTLGWACGSVSAGIYIAQFLINGKTIGSQKICILR